VKLYSTTDVGKSVHKAHGQFTHVVLNRATVLARPIPFQSLTIIDLPLYQYANWIPESELQLQRWQDKGGVLIAQGSHFDDASPDVTVMAECPYNLSRLETCNSKNAEYGVIPNPVSWTAHDETVDLRHPPVDFLKEIWHHCGGRQMSPSELSQASGWPVSQVQLMKNCFKPEEWWYVQKRLKPDRSELMPAWDWLEGGAVPKREVTKSGYRAAVEELGRFGYIGLKKLHHYPSETPKWRALEKERNAALKSLADVRLLVESLPDHLSS
jgi:hypothetical protein